MPKIINPDMYRVIAHGVFRATGQPQQIPRSIRMPAEMAAPYGVVQLDYAELEQRVTAVHPNEIKDVSDDNA